MLKHQDILFHYCLIWLFCHAFVSEGINTKIYLFVENMCIGPALLLDLHSIRKSYITLTQFVLVKSKASECVDRL